jgi:hypothetical protein
MAGINHLNGVAHRDELLAARNGHVRSPAERAPPDFLRPPIATSPPWATVRRPLTKRHGQGS